jgi:hypothetical protein
MSDRDDFRAKVFEDREIPGQWRVERAEPPNGEDITVRIFTGPDARQQALDYAGQTYGDFDEIRLEPYRR